MIHLGLFFLLASPALDVGLWNIELGTRQSAALEAFAPRGETGPAYWEQRNLGRVTELTYICRAQERCFSVPSSATLRFLDGKLAEVFLKIESERAPLGVNALESVRSELTRARFNGIDASSHTVGRQTRYFLRDGYTVVWIQDGPDSEIKLNLDRSSPVSRAEAVAAGAKKNLKHLVGARAYAAGHQAISKGQWSLAIEQFAGVLKKPGISPLLEQPTRVILAMALATRAKGVINKVRVTKAERAQANTDLERAGKLSPDLAPHFEKLKREAGRR